jgi:hypothetical protein
MNKKLIGAVIGGILIGLVLGIVISVVFNLSSIINPAGAGIGNQVQVSGKLQNQQNGTIYFTQLAKFHDDDEIKTSSPIVNGGYSVVLIGGQSYDVFVNWYPYFSDEEPDYTLYVPEGVEIYAADF